MSGLKWLWKYLRKHFLLYASGLLFMALFSIISIYVPQIMGWLVDDVIRQGNLDLLQPLLLLLVGVTIARTAVLYSQQISHEKVSQNVVHYIRSHSYQKLNKQDFPFFDTNRTGDIMAKMTGDLDAVRHFMAHVLPQLFKNILTMGLSVYIMFTIHPWFALCILSLAPIIFIITLVFGKTVFPRWTALRQQFSKLNTAVQENISGHRIVKAFHREDFEKEKFNRENEKFKDCMIHAAKAWETFLPPLDLMCNLMFVIVLLVGGIFVIKGTLTYGELVTFHGLVFRVTQPMRMLGWLVSDYQRFQASSGKIREMMDVEPKITNEGVKLDDIELKGKIEFKDVSFSYDTAPVLHNVNFVIQPGQNAAFIGATGSGKSTIMNLILRFYEANDGLVLIDRVNVKNIDLKVLRSQVSIAMQDVFLFTDTIEGNIAYGVPEADFEAVKKAALMAEAHDFIIKMADGYDTIVGERGVGLSGGQKQRIALARTLIKNPNILILDDTTSSLDMETEHRIQKTLEQFAKKRTTLTIAHRIASVKSADRIFVMDKGVIVEQGTHEELLLKKGLYYEVYANQMGDFDQKNNAALEVV